MKVLKQSEVNNLIQLHQSGQFALAEEEAKNLLNDFHQELILLNILGVSQEAQKKFKEAAYRDWETDRKRTRLNSSHLKLSRMPSSA